MARTLLLASGRGPAWPDSRKACTVKELEKTPFRDLVPRHRSRSDGVLKVSFCVEWEESDISGIRVPKLTDR
jgi:hypothetical protein